MACEMSTLVCYVTCEQYCKKQKKKEEKKTLTSNWIKKSKIWNFVCLSHSLTTVASLEDKQSSPQPPFYAKITHLLVGCASVPLSTIRLFSKLAAYFATTLSKVLTNSVHTCIFTST